MPRLSSLPTLFDECKQIRIGKLKSWNYLKPQQAISGTITWSRQGEKVASIGISVTTFEVHGLLTLSYKYCERSINYNVSLTSIPSNIGLGRVWYFVCPETGRRCRVLHLVSGRFYHRTAFAGCYYEKQTFSRNNRRLFNRYEKFFAVENSYSEIYSRHFRKTYNGVNTKRYTRLLKKIKVGQEIREEELYL